VLIRGLGIFGAGRGLTRWIWAVFEGGWEINFAWMVRAKEENRFSEGRTEREARARARLCP
jgi:hypothetical protein